MKDSRVKSFIVVGVIYVLAIAVGIVSYILLPMENVFLKLLLADVIATIFTFIFSVILKMRRFTTHTGVFNRSSLSYALQ